MEKEQKRQLKPVRDESTRKELTAALTPMILSVETSFKLDGSMRLCWEEDMLTKDGQG